MDELVFFYPKNHAAHYEYGHPERPERVETICQALNEAGWWDIFPHIDPIDLSIEVLSAIHDTAYLHMLEAYCAQERRLDMDTYTTAQSWSLALNSAGGAAAVAEAVWERKAARGFALCRPPGHHATRNRGMGFCLLNNVSLAVEHLQQTFGSVKLAIVDLDLHHGNGTQDIFWHRGDVFYISTHQSPHYPGTGHLEETGSGSGQGTTANIPLPPMTGDEGFRTVMRDGIMPLLDRYSPDMLLVSYGFDTHWRDPLGNLLLSASGYASIIQSLTNWADEHCEGRIMLVLEGGYDLEAAAACSRVVTAVLLGDECVDSLGPAPYPEGDGWRSILAEFKTIWSL